MNRDSILWLLSLARKAGKAEVGSFLSEKAIKGRRAELVIIAKDCSDNTKKKIKNCSEYYNVEFFEYSNMSELARVCGKENVSVVAVCDKNFANGIAKECKKTEKTSV